MLIPYKANVLSLDIIDDMFIWNEHRLQLWQAFLQFRGKLTELDLYGCRYWIDGSFATKKDEPGDIDLIVFIPHEQFKTKIEQLRPIRHAVPKIDCYFVEWFPVDHPKHDLAKADELTWYYFFRTDRRKRLKGFIEIND